MIVGSLVLILLAAGLLAGGFMLGSNWMLGASIVASLFAAVVLYIGARQSAAARARQQELGDDDEWDEEPERLDRESDGYSGYSAEPADLAEPAPERHSAHYGAAPDGYAPDGYADGAAEGYAERRAYADPRDADAAGDFGGPRGYEDQSHLDKQGRFDDLRRGFEEHARMQAQAGYQGHQGYDDRQYDDRHYDGRQYDDRQYDGHPGYEASPQYDPQTGTYHSQADYGSQPGYDPNGPFPPPASVPGWEPTGHGASGPVAATDQLPSQREPDPVLSGEQPVGRRAAGRHGVESADSELNQAELDHGAPVAGYPDQGGRHQAADHAAESTSGAHHLREAVEPDSAEQWRAGAHAAPEGAEATRPVSDIPTQVSPPSQASAEPSDDEEWVGGGMDEEDPKDEPPIQRRPARVAAAVAQMDTDVYVIDGRPRYHLSGCVHLLGREIEPLPVYEAIELGFSPCSLCEPDTALTSGTAQQTQH